MRFIYITLLVAVVVQFTLQNVIKNEKQNRIYKGKIAEPHSAPYMVALLIQESNGSTLCGGSLIKPKFVLTAAHCINFALSIKVFIGIRSLQQAYKNKNWVEVLTYKMHRNFNSFTKRNDIGIIELQRPVQLSSTIALVQLPKKSIISSLPGKYGRLTGFGDISDEKVQVIDILKELKVRILRTEDCQGYSILPSHLCGYGEEGGSACNGDSGSPLVLENTDIQIGIHSYGKIMGCTKGYPHIYTNVASYLDWIKRWSK